MTPGTGEGRAGRRPITATDASGASALVGRRRELAELTESLEDARRGRGGVHLVLGDTGIGKTRLTSALAERAAAAGARVIWTRGWGLTAPAYWPWVEVVRGLTQDLDGATLRRELGRAAVPLLRLAPELAERLPEPAPTAGEDEDSDLTRFALFDALVMLLRARSADAPVLILIDDLQAVDEGSLIALDFVSRMLRDAAVLIVATTHDRAPRLTRDAQLALQNVVRSGRRLVLGGLSREDIGRLIESKSGAPAAPALVDAVHAKTEGNPLFARELLELLLAEGRLDDPPEELPLPDGVRETIRRRLEPLDEHQYATLELAAIIGRTFALATLERASPFDRDSVLDALDAAAALGLVETRSAGLGEYRFCHVLIRDTLFNGMPITTRLNGHRLVGEALEHVYRGAIEAHLPEIAHHFLCAAPRGDIGKAVDYAERAAQRALDTLAFEQAADLFERALGVLERTDSDVPRRAGLLLGLGTAQARAGRRSARATFEAAVSAARSIDADEILARAALGLAPCALTAGYVDEAHVAVLGEALDRLDDRDSALRVALLGSLAVALYWSGDADRRAALAGEALEMARRLGDEPTLAVALSSAQLATSGPDTTEQGLAWLDELFALTARTGETVMSLAARSRYVDVLLELGDVAGADRAIETLQRLARDSRDQRAAALGQLHHVRRTALKGRLDDAERLLDEVASRVAHLAESPVSLAVASQGVLLTWLRHGARDIADLVRGYAAGLPDMPVWRAALAAALVDLGRREEAELEFDRLAADEFAALPRDTLWLPAMTLLSKVAVALELPDRALALHAELTPFAERNVVLPTVGFLGPVELWLGILDAVAGRDAEALGHLAAARARAMRDGARVSSTRIAIEQAAVLLRDGGEAARARAQALLADAAVDAKEMGLPQVAQQVAQLRAQLPGGATGAAGEGARASMRRVGDVWTITSRGRSIHLKDGRGVRLLALLLERPGSEVYSLDLVAAVDGVAPSGPLPEHSGGQETGGRFGVQSGTGPALDAKAKEEYRARVASLQAAVAAAESRRDEAGAAAAREELEFVRRELSSAVGIGGRDRQTGSHAERARINATRAIRSTIKRIAAYDERIGAELEAGVRTGTFCVYRPDPLHPLEWTVDRG